MNRYSEIPLNNLANGIFHGPYPKDPNGFVDHYLTNREQLGVPEHITDEQLIENVLSEVQYDQHAASVDKASKEFEITPAHALHMLDVVLRPWFVYWGKNHK